MNNRVYLLQVKCKGSTWETTDYFSSIEAAVHCQRESEKIFKPKYPFISFRVVSRALWSKKSYFQLVRLHNLKFVNHD